MTPIRTKELRYMTKKGIDKPLAARYFLDFMYNYWEAISDGHIVTLPLNLGAVQIVEKDTPYDDPSKMKIHWPETKRMWEQNPQAKEERKVIYFDNLHSEGKYIKSVFKRGRIRDWHMHWLYYYKVPRYAQIICSRKFMQGQRY